MQLLILYFSTATVFLFLDALMLKFVMRPLFEVYIGDWLLNEIRILPAVVFYLFYIAGVVWLISLPALRSENVWAALIGGAIFGAIAYGTYEFTNYATLKNWNVNMVLIDVTWGAILTGVSTWAGVSLTKVLA